MRGRQAPAGQAEPPRAGGGSAESSAAPAMSFYHFEAQWARLRGKPRDRVALLRRLGARQLPALFRESLDSELVASVVEALEAELHEEAAAAEFAATVLGALARTPRFDLSMRGLSPDERRLCGQVLERCGEAGRCSEEDLQGLHRAYAPPPPPAPREPLPPEAPAAAVPPVPVPAPAPPAVGPLPEPTPAAEEVAPAPSQAVPAPAQAFSLDDCD